MLELNDPVWSHLNTAYGDGEEAVQLLRRLITDAEDAESRQELFELLLHQDTIYAATLAAMPYLAEMAERTGDAKTLVDLYIACGWMESGREHAADRLDISSSGEFRRKRQPRLSDKAVFKIAEGYRDGLERLSRLYERTVATDSEKNDRIGGTDADLNEDRQENENPEAVYLLAAHAAYAGEIATARLLFNFPEGDEYGGACPNCRTDWYVRPQEEKAGELAVYTEDPVAAKKEGHASAAVQAVSKAGLRAELQTLEREARRLGAFSLAVAVSSLDGQAVCPECGVEASVWEALTS